MSYQYRVAGQPVTLVLDPTVVAIRFEDDLPKSSRARAAEAVSGMRPFSARFEVPGERLTLVPIRPPSMGGIRPADAIDALDTRPEVAKAMPVFRVGHNQVVPTDRIILAARLPTDLPRIMAKYELTPLREREGETLVRVAQHVDVFELCSALDADAMIDFAEPDFVTIGRHISSRASQSPPVTVDPLAAGQYAMTITRAFDAQALQGGSRDIRIAILDEGVDTLHPDLKPAVADRYDAIDNDSYQEPNRWDGHGTACAGLAAAVPGNGTGVRGAGAGCALVPVRIAQSLAKGGAWSTTNETIARGIDWAWREGRADVLSNSWGGGSPSNSIIRAFDRARCQGRGGRGCVVVIAAGNYASAVTFPATLPGVLTVSASNEFDEIKTPTSGDHETWWGTSYGPQVSVAAPGVHNLTTDISGANGYVVGDYTATFNGTSSATPIVAGACGLLLSARPDLHELDVRDAICQTADKIGAEPYIDGRNDYAGYGRLNVLRALLAVRPTRPAEPGG